MRRSHGVRSKTNIVRELAGKSSGDAARRLIALALDDGDLRIATAAIRQLALHVGGRSKKTSVRGASPKMSAAIERRRQSLIAHCTDPAYVRSVFVLMRDLRIADRDRELGAAPAPVEASEHDGESRQVEGELVRALPAPQVEQPPCICGHKREAHPGDGPCDACQYKGIRPCGLYSPIGEAEEVRALRKRDPFSN
jgi:hypothetical protein